MKHLKREREIGGGGIFEIMVATIENTNMDNILYLLIFESLLEGGSDLEDKLLLFLIYYLCKEMLS